MDGPSATPEGGKKNMSEIMMEKDERLVDRLLARHIGSWNEFVDRFLPLIYKVISFSAAQRHIPVNTQDTEDIAAEVMLKLVENDYAILKRFEGRSTFQTYLTVITRRICLQSLSKKHANSALLLQKSATVDPPSGPIWNSVDEVHDLLKKLPRKIRLVMMLHYLEGRSYEEISKQLRIPVNTIGPILSRAKTKLRQRVQIQSQPKQVLSRRTVVA